MRPLLTITIFLAFLLGSIRAEEKILPETSIKGSAKNALYGEWFAQTVATDPKFHLVFKIDKNGKVIHHIYTGWQWKTKRLIQTLTGTIDVKTFEKDRRLKLVLKDGKESITYKVRFVKDGIQFLMVDPKMGSNIYDHRIFKPIKKHKMHNKSQ